MVVTVDNVNISEEPVEAFGVDDCEDKLISEMDKVVDEEVDRVTIVPFEEVETLELADSDKLVSGTEVTALEVAIVVSFPVKTGDTLEGRRDET